MTPTDLLAKLEGAECGSPALDLEVWNAASPDAPWRWVDEHRETITCDRYGPGAVGNPICSLDPFTRSVDAALSLVPEGWGWQVRINNGGSVAYCILLSPAEGRNGDIYLEAATAPLAICSAALKARSVLHG